MPTVVAKPSKTYPLRDQNAGYWFLIIRKNFQYTLRWSCPWIVIDVLGIRELRTYRGQLGHRFLITRKSFKECRWI